MFRLPISKSINKCINSFSINKNTTFKFKSFKIKYLALPSSFQFLEQGNISYSDSYDYTLVNNNKTYILNEEECDNLSEFLIANNLQVSSIVDSSTSINNYLTLFLPDKESNQITNFIVDLINKLSSLSGISLSDNSKKLSTESINISLSYNYKQAPKLSISFTTFNLSLNNILKTILKKENYKDLTFTLFNIPFILDNFTSNLVKKENKSNNIVSNYTLNFTHLIEYYSNKSISLFKIPILSNIKDNTDTNPLGYYCISLEDLSLAEIKGYISNGITTYFFTNTSPDITETTTLSSEISKVESSYPSYTFYNDKLYLKTENERSKFNININEITSNIESSSTFNNFSKIKYPLSCLTCIDTEIKKIEDNKNNLNKSKAFYFEEVKPNITIIEENKDASKCPENITILSSLDFCFDKSGETKSYILSKYEGSTILSQEITTYGFAYNATDIFNFNYGDNPSDKFQPSVTVKGVPAQAFWTVVSTQKIEYKYGSYGYLMGISSKGTRLARFENSDSEVEDIIRERELYYLSNKPDLTLSEKEIAEAELLNWKLGLYKFIVIPSIGYTNYTIHPIDGVFKDKDYLSQQYIIYYDPINKKKVAIKDERYTPSYFASYTKTYKSSFAKTANKIIDKSNNTDSKPFVLDFYGKPYLTTGEEYVEETKISIIKNEAIYYYVSSNSGFPIYGSGSENIPRFVEYNRKTSSQECSFKDCVSEENISYKEGIPPEHSRKENYMVLKYYKDLDINKPKEENLTYFYYSNKEDTPNVKDVEDKEYNSQLLPVKTRGDILRLLKFQLNDQIINSLGTFTFTTLYNPYIREGDLVKVVLDNSEYYEGIVLSKDIRITTVIIDSKIYYKTLCSFVVSNGTSDCSIIETEIKTYMKDKDKNKENSDISFTADPINLSGLKGSFVVDIISSRGKAI